MPNGKKICYLTIVDEHSGAALDAIVFNYARINQVPLEEMKLTMIQLFQRWGRPGAIRVDNGEPFGSPEKSTTPPFALWLIAHKIRMIWNDPNCPQQNGKVERMQGTSIRWSEVKNFSDLEVIQNHLRWAINIQAFKYPVTRLNNLTRIQCFPELLQNHRQWNLFNVDARRVWNFIAQKKYVRKVSAAGQIRHFGQTSYIDQSYAKQYVTLTLDPIKLEWWVFDAVGNCIKTITAKELALKRILNFSVFSKNSSDTT